MNTPFSIKVYKQYFNFSSAHFLVFADGKREPLHGHNYSVQLSGSSEGLHEDMVFDFLDIKPIVREVCNSLDHKTLLPLTNKFIKISDEGSNYTLKTIDEAFYSFPKSDVLLLEMPNISAERLAEYILKKISDLVLERFQFKFKELAVEVEESPGQSATARANGV